VSESILLALIRANAEYEHCAADLHTSRVFMGLAKDKNSRKNFETSLAAVNRAHHEKSKLETALLDYCREEGVKQAGY